MADQAVARWWGRQTELAIANFPISGEPMPWPVVEALLLVKAEAARVNADLGVIPRETADAIERAVAELVDEKMVEQFPVDVFQTGSGTSTNMNVNEVVAHRASELLGAAVHPNDHVNTSQSSNDTFPSAVRIAAARTTVHEVLPALDSLAEALTELAHRHLDTVKAGRTHLMDAVPMTFGQEVAGWARVVRLGRERFEAALPRVLELPLGGTAVGTGLNAPEDFAAAVIEGLARRTGLALREAVDHFEAQSSQDALVEIGATAKVVALGLHKIAGDLRLLGSGPATGLGEVRLPELQAGSSIMPGKVNPVIAEVVQQVAAQVVGNDAAATFAATASTLQLSTAMPLLARSVLSSLTLIASATNVLAERCVRGIEVDVDRMARHAASSAALVTSLAPNIGYDAAARLVRQAVAEGRSVRDVVTDAGLVDEQTLDAAMDLGAMARPRVSRGGPG
ncbi:MAG: class II fumarate hydratase [Actinomycetota bacterium]|nr:MAG: class II fumarate hydratase [Actinomycetota bacterium]